MKDTSTLLSDLNFPGFSSKLDETLGIIMFPEVTHVADFKLI